MDNADDHRDAVVVVEEPSTRDRSDVNLREGLLDRMSLKDENETINWRTLYIPQRVTRHVRRVLEGCTESPGQSKKTFSRSPAPSTRRRRSSVIVVEEQHIQQQPSLSKRTNESISRSSKRRASHAIRQGASKSKLEPIFIDTEAVKESRKRRRLSTEAMESSSTTSNTEKPRLAASKIQNQRQYTPSDHRVCPSTPPDDRVSTNNGQWRMKGTEWQFMVRHSCQRCMQMRTFCDRGQPCGSCFHLKIACRRKPGLSALGARQVRPRKKARQIRQHGKLRVSQWKSTKKEVHPKRAYVRRKGLDCSSSSHKSTVELLNLSSVDDIPSHVKTIVKKPQALGKPKVWCEETRQELCESVPYFRSFQGGIYISEGVPYGYLLDGFGAPRDIFHDRVIISHGGGKSGTYEGGKFGLISSQQSSDSTISALLASQKLKRPIILVAGSKYEACTFELPHRYCILGWYMITDSWAEGEYHDEVVRIYDGQGAQEGNEDENGIGQLKAQRQLLVRWKFRFEWLPQQGRPFWEETKVSAPAAHPVGEQESASTCHQVDAPPNHFCQTCQLSSPLVYANAAMCLREECDAFWSVSDTGETLDPPGRLQYSDVFLRARNSTYEIGVPFDVVPPAPPDAASYANRTDLTRVFWRGFHCKNCGRLSCRERWDAWDCRNCHNTVTPGRRVFSAQEVSNIFRPIYAGAVMDNGNPVVSSEIDIQYEHLLHQGTHLTQNIFTFPSVNDEPCRVIHLLGNAEQNFVADELFKEFQASRVPFRRHELTSHKVQGRFLVNQFSFNAGAPYKHVVAIETTPMNGAPSVVQQSMSVIQDHVRNALMRMKCFDDVSFNEILAIAYMEEQKMGFHDDGEEGVGPVIASMSFGSEAIMQFRQKRKMARPIMNNEEALDEAEMERYQEQERGYGDAGTDDESFDTTWQARPSPKNVDNCKQLARDLFRRTNSRSRLALQLTLHHGDVLIMQGSGIQKHYEHSVIPKGFRIVATARSIHET